MVIDGFGIVDSWHIWNFTTSTEQSLVFIEDKLAPEQELVRKQFQLFGWLDLSVKRCVFEAISETAAFVQIILAPAQG